MTFINGSDRFIEIGLRPSATGGIAPNAFTILGPRQKILSVPYAITSNYAQISNLAQNADHALQADNATTAANALKLGGVDAARFVQQDGTGNLSVSGNVTQPLTANGLPKALLRLDRDGNILRCYNGITGASTNGCGFSVAHNVIGGYDISLGSQLNSSTLIVNVTTEFDGDYAVGVLQSRLGASLSVGVRYISNNNATNAPLHIVIY